MRPQPQPDRRVSALLIARVLALPLACSACGDGIAVAIGPPRPDSGVSEAGDAALDGDALDGPDGAEPSDAGTGDVPAIEHCAPVANWPADNIEHEQALLALITDLRAPGEIACGGQTYAGLQPLRAAPELRCSARLHSMDMVVRQFRDITNPDGEDPPARMTAAGSRFDRWGEVFRSVSDPDRALAGILSDQRYGCTNLGNPAYRAIGIGYYEGVWTVDFTDR